MATPHASGLNLCARLNYSCDDERDAGGLSARTLQTSSASIVQPTVVMHQHAANNNNNNNNNNMGTVGSNAATYSAFQHQHLAQTRGTAQTSHANARMHFASGTTPAVGNTHSMRGSVHTNVQQARRMTGAPYSSAASGRPYQFGGFAARLMTPALAMTTSGIPATLSTFGTASTTTTSGRSSRRDQITRFAGGSGRVTTARPFRIQARVNLHRLATPATAPQPMPTPMTLPSEAQNASAAPAVVPMAVMTEDAEPGDELVVLPDGQVDEPAGFGSVLDDDDDDDDDMGGDDFPMAMGGDDDMDVEDYNDGVELTEEQHGTPFADDKENATPGFVPLRSPTFDEPIAVAKMRKPRGPANQRLRDAFKLRQSLANKGTTCDEETGVRRSTRQRVRPLEWWRNEHVIYGREHRSLASVVGVSMRSPDPLWPRNAPRVQKPKAKSRLGGNAGAPPPPPPPTTQKVGA